MYSSIFGSVNFISSTIFTMQCTLALVVAVFLIGTNVFETVDSVTQNGSPLQQKKRAPKVGNPAGLNGQKLAQFRIKVAAVNPTNLISALISEDEENLDKAIGPLKKLKQVVRGKSDFSNFMNNLIDLIQNMRSASIDSINDSTPTYFELLKKAGNELSSIAKCPEGSRAIFNAETFKEITSPLDELFVFSDESAAEPGQEE